MSEKVHSVKWHTYPSHLRDVLQNMMKSNDLKDVTLVCDDKIILKAHKVVLSACSSIFKSTINELYQNDSVIFLMGIHHQEMESILEFMYLGEAMISQERLNDFLDVARSLNMANVSNNTENQKIMRSKEKMQTPIKSVIKVKDDEEDRKSSFMQEMSKTSINELQYDIKVGNYIETKIKVEETEESSLIDSILRKFENKFSCEKCKGTFTTKSHLRTHIRAIHEGVKYACNQCYKQFPQTGHLRRHIKSVHEGVKYDCNLCDERFTLQNSLRAHIYSIHVGEKYDCTQCNEQFSKKFNLQRHYKRCKAMKKIDFTKV